MTHRRSPTDSPGLAIGFVFANDTVHGCAAFFVENLDSGAEKNLVAFLCLRIDDNGTFQPFGQVAHAPVDFTQLFLAVDVFRIFTAIALGGSIGHFLHGARTLDGPEASELFRKTARAVRRDV